MAMTQRTRIKICGTTNRDDAWAAVAAGVDALGFIFAEKSPRCISPEDAKKIIVELPPFVDLVGVFVDKDPTELEEIVHYCGLNHVQLHGQESPEYCKELASRFPVTRIMKAFRVSDMSRVADFVQYNDVVSGFLLDTYSKGQSGGTGKTFNWDIIPTLGLKRPFILAGGLSPENIEAAITNVQPYAVDINSGIELSPGVKDHEKLQDIVAKIAACAGRE